MPPLIATFAVAAAGTALVIAGLVTDLPPAFHRHAAPAALATALGMTVGASEILSRYRDEPIRALASNAGLVYLGLNGAVSGLTYGLLTRYAESFAPGLADDRLMTAIVAGFGAMAILRSKFFTIRTPKGEEIAVGPDAAVAAFLAAADRGVDRTRAARRLAFVQQRASKIKSATIGREYFQICLAAFQNLAEDEKTGVIGVIDSVAASEYPDELKLQAMCYAVLQLAGERNFHDIMSALKDYEDRTSTPAAEPPAPA